MITHRDGVAVEQMTILCDEYESQNLKVLNHLREIGPLTPLHALKIYGVERLASRIYDLRYKRNVPIRTDMVRINGKRFARYSLDNVL